MYIPKAFEVADQETIFQFIETYSFATLVSNAGGEMFATHLPLIADGADRSSATLYGHVARANPHWRALEEDPRVLAIFSGPHAYISPTWYASAPAVPTWNYAAVHVYGSARVVDDADLLAHLLDRLIEKHESPLPNPWSGALPDDFKMMLLKAIVGIEIEIDRIEAKFKLSQNRPLNDQAGMLAALNSVRDTSSRELAAFAREFLGLLAAGVG
jgi:transcriptional regulator